MSPEPSKWMFVNIRNFTTCPRCGAKPEQPCRMPKGRVAPTPHVERCIVFAREHPEMVKLSRGEL